LCDPYKFSLRETGKEEDKHMVSLKNTVLVLKPGRKFALRKFSSTDERDTLHFLQGCVGGPIESATVHFPALEDAGITVYCNEEGIEKNLKPNIYIDYGEAFEKYNVALMGNVVFVKYNDNDEIIPFTKDDLKLIVETFRYSGSIVISGGGYQGEYPVVYVEYKLN
jgi:hypothetical protein